MANTYSDQFKLRQPAIGDTGWDDEVNENVQILEVFLAALKQGNSVVSGLAPSDGGGLQVDYAAGVADVGDAKRTVGASNESCTANVKNWLYVNSSGTVVISTTVPTGDFCPIAMIDAGAAAIDRIADLRFFGEIHIGYKSDGMRYAADAEGSDTYVITLSPVPAAYYNGMVVNFKANTANTGAATLNVNALGAKTIKKMHDQDLETGDIESGQIVTLVYDGTNFQMQSQTGVISTIPTINLTGGQIAFPATAAPSANVNTLDDYEEGTWTLTAADAVSGGNTSTTGTGTYTKIGNMVTIAGSIQNIDITGLNAGNTFYIQGLPFGCGSFKAFGALRIDRVLFAEYVSAEITNATSAVRIVGSKSAAAEEWVTVSDLTDDNADIFFTITYSV